MRKRKTRKIYLHEASHAIVALSMGVKVKGIVVYPGGQADGTLADTDLDVPDEPDVDLDVKLVAVACAGAVADHRLRIDPSYHSFDMGVARECAHRARAGRGLTGLDARWDPFRDGFDEARDRVPQYWPVIEQVADALEANDGSVDGTIIDEIWRGRDAITR